MKETQSRIHCFDPVVDGNTEVLIIGTMPGQESLKQGMYYANANNHFWEFMYLILQPESLLLPLVDRNIDKSIHYKLLLSHRIGLWDIVKDCKRTGSKDSEIREETFNDLTSVISKNVKLIICSSPKALNYLKVSGQIQSIKVPIKSLGSTSSMNPNNTFKVLEEWKNMFKEYRTI